MANPRKFSEKIALHHQKQAEETAAFEKIMREVSDATQKVNSSKVPRAKPPPEPNIDLTGDHVDTTLQSTQQALGTFRSGSLPNVAAPQATDKEPEAIKPEDVPLANQYAMAGGRSGGTSPSRAPGQRGRTSSSVGPIRRPADRKHDTSPYGSSAYLSPPPDSNWRRTNSDSALHQSCGEQQAAAQPLSPHRPLHSHAHPHLHPHQNHHRRSDIHLDVLAPMNPANRPRSSCGLPNNNNVNTYSVYKSGGDGGGGGGLACGDMAVPGGSLPDLTSVHFPPPHYALPHRTSPDYQPRYSPTSPGAVSPGGGSVSPATGGLSPASGSPVGATVPMHNPHQHDHQAPLYDAQNHLSVPNTNNYLHHNKNMSPLDHQWIPSGYQTHCSPPSQYSSTSNINIPSPTMVHSPGSPVESPQTDYNNLHQALLQPFEQITMLDNPVSSYNTTYLNHGSPHSPQATNNSSLTYPQLDNPVSSYNKTYLNHGSPHSPHSPQTTNNTTLSYSQLDNPVSSYNTTYLNHGSPHSPHSPQATNNSQLTYSQLDNSVSSYKKNYLNHGSPHSPQATNNSPLSYHQSTATSSISGVGRARDPVAGGGFTLQPLASPSAPPTPATPASIPDIVLTDYSGSLDAGMFGGEEASLRAGLDLDELSLLEDPTALVPDSAVEHEFRLDRL